MLHCESDAEGKFSKSEKQQRKQCDVPNWMAIQRLEVKIVYFVNLISYSMPYFIYHLKLTASYRDESNWTNETKAIVSEHFNHLKKNFDNGRVLVVGKSDL